MQESNSFSLSVSCISFLFLLIDKNLLHITHSRIEFLLLSELCRRCSVGVGTSFFDPDGVSAKDDNCISDG